MNSQNRPEIDLSIPKAVVELATEYLRHRHELSDMERDLVLSLIEFMSSPKITLMQFEPKA